MENTLNIIQIVLAVALIVVILLQNKGTGLGSIMGGDGNVYRTKRGFEKTLFYSTIAISIAFFGVAIANILIRR